ncbi:MAG TPA: BatD family protein [Longimicrobiales bacterium]|nr:BatD family protein [Longimicrobiales bacterium]
MTALAFVAALLLQAPQDPVHVSASLGASQISVGATTTLRIEVEARGTTSPEIATPALPAGLEMVGSSDFSQLRLSAPGQSRRSSRRELVIRGAAPGVYTIPSVQVVVGTRRYQTDPLELTVTGTARPRPGLGGEEAAVASATTLRLSVEPDTVYVGQQVMLTAEAVFAEAARLRQTRPASFEPPAATGFWVQDLPDPITVSLRVADGRSVETQTYRRAYFPLRAGTLWFPPAHLHYELRRGFLQAPENRRIASDSLALVVLPVPSTGQPASFTGAVGRYELRASVAPSRVAVGDAAVLTVELTGQGNIRALPEPRLAVPDGLELLPPTQESSVQVTDDVVGGSKAFRWVLVPEQSRSFVIPPIEYSYFDPELRTFITLRSDPLALQAVPLVAPEPEDTLLRPLRERPGSAPAAWALSPWFAAAQAVPLLLVGFAGAVLRRRQRPPGPAQHARRIRRDLDALPGEADPPHTLAGIERLLKEAVRLVAGFDDGEPVAALRAAGRHDAASALDALLFELRRARYAPGSAGSEAALVQGLVDRADRFIAGLARHRRRARHAGLMVVLATCAGATIVAVAASASDPASALFEDASARLAAGDGVAAANAFHAYARLRPRDPAGWYNTGVAAYAAGDPGRAVWAWLRAARLAPRDDDTRHNLRLAGASGAAADVVPLDRLAAGERAVLAALTWWFLVFAAGHAVFRRQPRAWTVAGAAGLGLLMLAGTAVHAARRPVLVVPMGQGATAYAGSSIHDERLAELRPGMTARLMERHGGWLLVRLPDGGRGWVERSRVAAP